MPVTPPPPPPNLCSSLAPRLTRLSPLLLLAAALVALAVFFAPGAQPAQAQIAVVWSATLTPQDLSNLASSPGCSDIAATVESDPNLGCSTDAALTDDDFTYDGVSYELTQLAITSAGDLHFGLDKTIPSGLSVLTVNGRGFLLTDATLSTDTATDDVATWSSTGLSEWSVGDTVTLRLTAGTPTPPIPAPGSTEYWSGTLTAKAVDDGFGCGFRTGQPQCSAQLTDDSVTYHGTDYTIELVHVAYGDTLQLILSSEPKDSDRSTTERSRMALNVGTGFLAKQFLVKDATVSYGAGGEDTDDDGVSDWTKPDAWVLTWTGSGLSWSADARVSLSLVTLPAGGL